MKSQLDESGEPWAAVTPHVPLVVGFEIPNLGSVISSAIGQPDSSLPISSLLIYPCHILVNNLEQKFWHGNDGLMSIRCQFSTLFPCSSTTLQSMIIAKLSPHRFWPCHENGLTKTIQTIPHNLYVSFKSASLYCGLRLILVYPNPQ